MKRSEFLSLLEEVVEAGPGTISGSETVARLEGWNSLAVISFMALADERLGVTLQPRQISGCKTVADLIGLLGDKVSG
jgi:acyl carrier protein